MSRHANDWKLVKMANELQDAVPPPGAPEPGLNPKYCTLSPPDLWRVVRVIGGKYVTLGVARYKFSAALFADAMTVNLWPWFAEEYEDTKVPPGVLNFPLAGLSGMLVELPAVLGLANRVSAHLVSNGYLQDLEQRRRDRMLYKNIADDQDKIADDLMQKAKQARLEGRRIRRNMKHSLFGISKRWN